MKRFLSSILLFSLLLIQVHGLEHSFSDSHDQSHNCTICKIQHDQDDVIPSAAPVSLVTRILLDENSSKLVSNFLFNSILSKNSRPRAPPLS